MKTTFETIASEVLATATGGRGQNGSRVEAVGKLYKQASALQERRKLVMEGPNWDQLAPTVNPAYRDGPVEAPLDFDKAYAAQEANR